MKKILDKGRTDTNSQWFSWLSNKWNSYEAFEDINFGTKPKEVAEKFFDLNRDEFEKLFDCFDDDDIDALDQLQKLIESESHVFKLIKSQINCRNKVIFVDFQKKR